MTDIADVFPTDSTRYTPQKARRTLVTLMLLGLPKCRPFTIGVSAVGGCDWLQ
jgi:hypothetical protein